MNPEQWTSLIRTVLAIAIGPGSYVVMKGILPAELANQLIPVLVPLIMAGGATVIGKWGINTHSDDVVVKAAVTNSPAAVVAAVNSDAVPGVKVVSADSPAPQVILTAAGDVRVDKAAGNPGSIAAHS